MKYFSSDTATANKSTLSQPAALPIYFIAAGNGDNVIIGGAGTLESIIAGNGNKMLMATRGNSEYDGTGAHLSLFKTTRPQPSSIGTITVGRGANAILRGSGTDTSTAR